MVELDPATPLTGPNGPVTLHGLGHALVLRPGLYWTTLRGVEAMDNSLALMDLTAYGRQESWEDSPDLTAAP
jgi:hypothetical protein